MMSQKGLPQFSFISSEAIFWAVEQFDAIANESQAVELFQSMIKAGLICHCSHDRRHEFICGLYLYYIVDKKSKDDHDDVDLEMFQKDWLEIEMSYNEVDEKTRLTPFSAPYTQSTFTQKHLNFRS